MMLAEAAGLGVVIGLLLGALGGGGGVLVVPGLVYVLGQSGQDATSSSVIIVGLAAGAGAIQRLRSGTLDRRMSLMFGVLGIPGAYLGTRLNHLVAQHVLMLAFAGVTLAAAAAMFGGNRKCRARERRCPTPDEAPAATCGGTTAATRGGTTLLAGPPTTERRSAMRTSKVVACASGIGFLTGFLTGDHHLELGLVAARPCWRYPLRLADRDALHARRDHDLGGGQTDRRSSLG